MAAVVGLDPRLIQRASRINRWSRRSERGGSSHDAKAQHRVRTANPKISSSCAQPANSTTADWSISANGVWRK